METGRCEAEEFSRVCGPLIVYSALWSGNVQSSWFGGILCWASCSGRLCYQCCTGLLVPLTSWVDLPKLPNKTSRGCDFIERSFNINRSRLTEISMLCPLPLNVGLIEWFPFLLLKMFADQRTLHLLISNLWIVQSGDITKHGKWEVNGDGAGFRDRHSLHAGNTHPFCCALSFLSTSQSTSFDLALHTHSLSSSSYWIPYWIKLESKPRFLVILDVSATFNYAWRWWNECGVVVVCGQVVV